MRGIFLGLASIGVVAGGATAAAQVLADGWWSPGEARGLAASVEYPNAAGMVGILNASGPVETRGHPFFEPIGANGRACVTCHQPAEAMSVTAASIARRWQETNGKDPIFAAIDGSNCPSLPQDQRASHSLAIERGLFRVALPWPPKRRPDGAPNEPEFTIEVVRDPTGCNTSPVYGLKSPAATISVFRRPRMVANMKYIDTEGPVFNAETGAANPVDPETRKPSNLNLTSDARVLSLTHQARDAAGYYLEKANGLSPDQLSRIVAFERQVYVAQSRDRFGADFAAAGMPQGLGPRALLEGKPGLAGGAFKPFEAWKSATPAGEAAAFRSSVARGSEVFSNRPFLIRDAMHINSAGLGNPAKGTCATCHAMQLTGMQPSSGWVDVGAANAPFASERPDLPLFKITCSPDAPPHLFLGRVIYTQDPGRALISGRCMDVGSIVMPQLRGLSARAPYFANGSARNLREVVDFYDRRFNIRYSEQEKQDLVNFLSVL